MNCLFFYSERALSKFQFHRYRTFRKEFAHDFVKKVFSRGISRRVPVQSILGKLAEFNYVAQSIVKFVRCSARRT